MDFSDLDRLDPENSAADADLSGLSKQEAYEYVRSFVTTLKSVQRKLEEAGRTLSLWQERARLAYEKQDRELARVALEKWEASKAEVERLQEEERKLARTVDLLKQNFAKLRRTPEMSVDAEALNQQMEEIVGSHESRKTEKSLRDIEIDSQLEQLRKKISNEDNE